MNWLLQVIWGNLSFAVACDAVIDNLINQLYNPKAGHFFFLILGFVFILNSLGMIIPFELREYWISSHVVPSSQRVIVSPGTWGSSGKTRAAAERREYGENKGSQSKGHRVWEVFDASQSSVLGTLTTTPKLPIAGGIWGLMSRILSQKLAYTCLLP